MIKTPATLDFFIVDPTSTVIKGLIPNRGERAKLMIDRHTEPFSETWLLERTYHAQLYNGQEISVPDLTQAMKAIAHFYVAGDLPARSLCHLSTGNSCLALWNTRMEASTRNRRKQEIE